MRLYSNYYNNSEIRRRYNQENVEKLSGGSPVSARMYQQLNLGAVDEIVDITNRFMIGVGSAKDKDSKNKTLQDHTAALEPLLLTISKMGSPKVQSGKQLLENVLIENQVLNHYFIPYNQIGNLRKMRDYYNAYKDEKMILAYDTEVLAGVDKTGAKRFFGITEFAYNLHNIDDSLETTMGASKKALLGIDEKAMGELVGLINEGNFYHSSGMGSVVGRRFALYANKNSEYLINDKIYTADQILNMTSQQLSALSGTWQVKQLADLPENYIPTKEEMLGGARLLHQAYKSDMSTKSGSTGLSQGQQFLREMYGYRKQYVSVGHNSILSDRFWEQGHLFRYDDTTRNLILDGFEFEKERHIDSLVPFRAASHASGQSAIIGPVKDWEKGPLTLEALSERILGKELRKLGLDGVHHEAGYDTAVLAYIMNSLEMNKAFIHLPDVEESAELLPGQQLLLNRGTFNNRGNVNPLAFRIYPTGDIRLTNGYTFNKEGRLVEDSFSEGILQKNGLYTISATGKMKITPEMREHLERINADYAMDELYFSIFNPYSKKQSLRTSSQSIYFYRSKEEQESHVGQMRLVGDRDKESGKFVRHNQANGSLFNIYDPSTNQTKTYEFDDYIEYMQNKMEQDKIRSNVAQHEINTIDKVRKLHTLASTSLIKRDARYDADDIISVFLNQDQQLAAKVSTGDTITLDVGLDQIAQKIGFFDQNYSETIERVYENTIDKTLGMMDYYITNRNTINQVRSYVYDNYGKGNDSFQEAKAYEVIMKNLVLKTSYSPQGRELGLDELSRAEFDLSNMTTVRHYNVMIGHEPETTTRVMRLDLNNPSAQYSLIQQLFENRDGVYRKEDKSLDHETQAKLLLEEFMKKNGIRSSEPIRKLSSASLAEDIIQQLRQKKQQDPGAFVLHKTEFMPRHTAIQLDEYFSKLPKDALTNALNEASAFVPQFYQLREKSGRINRETIKRMSTDIVNIFSDQISNDFYASNPYFSKEQAKYLQHIYQDAQLGYRQYLETFLSTYSGYDNVDFMVGKNRQFAVRVGEKVYDLTDKMPQLRMYGSTSYIQVGRNKVALTGALLGKEQNWQSVRVGSEFTKIANESKVALYGAQHRIDEGFTDILGSIQYSFGRFANNLRELSSVSQMNKSEKRSNAFVNTDYAFSLLGVLADKGIINLSDKELKEVKSFMETDVNPSKYLSRERSSSFLRNIYGTHSDKIIKYLLKNAPEGTPEAFVLLNSGPFTEENKHTAGYIDTMETHMPFSKYIPNRRITLGKNNFVSFRMQDAQKRVSEIFGTDYEKQGLRLESTYMTAYGKTLNTGRLQNFAELDTKLSNEIVGNKLLTSHKSFHQVMENYLASQRKNETMGVRQLDFINQALRHANLMDDATLMDPRLLDTVFNHDPKPQQVVFDKEFIASNQLSRNFEKTDYKLEVNSDTGEVAFKYGRGTYRKANQEFYRKKGFLGVEEMQLAKYDGMVRMGFTTGEQNFMLSEDEINTLLKGKTIDEAEAYLNGLEKVFYLERSGMNNYVKMYTSQVEKSKSFAPLAALGQLDDTITEELRARASKKGKAIRHTLNSMVGSINTYEQIEGLLDSLDYQGDERTSMLKRIERERYTAWTFIQNAYRDAWEKGKNKGSFKEFHMISSEDSLGHGGTAQSIEELILSMRQYHVDRDTVGDGNAAQRAAETVVGQLKNIYREDSSGKRARMTSFDSGFAEDGNILFRDTESAEDIDIEAFVKMIRDNYGDYFDYIDNEEFAKRYIGKSFNVMGEDGVRRQIGTVTSASISRNEEFDKVSGAMPVAYVDSVYHVQKQIDAMQNKIGNHQEEIKRLKARLRSLDDTQQMNKKNKKKSGKMIDKATEHEIKMIRDKIVRLSGQIEESEKEKRLIVSGYKRDHRGATYGDREVLSLSNYKYDKELLERVVAASKVKGEDVFEQLFGEGFDPNATDRRMLKNVIEAIQEEVLTSSSYDLLDGQNNKEVINRVVYDGMIRKSLMAMYDTNKKLTTNGKLSVESLMNRYILERHANAVDFNSIEGELKIQKTESKKGLLEKGFRELDIRNYQLSHIGDAPRIEQGNSMFASNILLNIRGREVAIPYMPHSSYNENIVQKHLENKIGELRFYDEQMDKYEVGSAAYNKYMESVDRAILELKTEVKNVTSKESVLTDMMKARAERSVYVSASALIPRINETVVEDGKKITRSVIRNDSDLVKAIFQGRSIQDWYEDDVFVNAAFAGDKVFETMGFFSEKAQEEFYNASILGSDGKRYVDINGVRKEVTKDNTLERIKDVLETHGVDTIDTRFPNIQQGSSTASILYYSRDPNLSDNKVRFLHGVHARKAGDYDGDSNSFRVVNYLDRDGKRYLNSFEILMSGKQNLEGLRQGFKHALATDAVTSNRFYELLSRAGVDGESQRIAMQNLYSIAEDRTFDGTLVGEQVFNPEVTISEVEAFKASSKMNELTQLAKNANETLDYANPESIAKFINNLNVGPEEKIDYKNAYRTKLSLDFRMITQTARDMKDAIGEINTPLYELRQMKELLEASGDFNSKTSQAIQEILYPIEQTTISAKNMDDVFNKDKAGELVDILNAAYYGKTVQGKNETFEKTVDNFLDNYVKPTFIKKYGSGESVYSQAEFMEFMQYGKKYFNDEFDQFDIDKKSFKAARASFNEEVWEQGKSAFKSLLNRLDNQDMRNARAYFRIHAKGSGTHPFAVRPEARNYVDAKDVFTVKNLYYGMNGPDDTSVFKPIDVTDIVSRDNHAFDKIELDRKALAKASAQVAELGADTFDLTRLASLKDIQSAGASVAAGLVLGAGAYMLVGALGQSVTANTTNQGEQEFNQEQESTLSDYGSDYEYDVQNTGYVINMRGRTESEKMQKIVGNLNQSLSNSLNANLQMTLNINETPLRDFQINRLVESALRL